jgi:hypothetical protein
LKAAERYRIVSYSLTSLLIALACSSCVYSDYPLSSKGSHDDRILGHWRLTDGEATKQIELTITADKDNWYSVEQRELAPGQKEHTAVDRCYPTLSKAGDFLNVEFRLPAKADKHQGEQVDQKFMFIKYAVSKNELSIWNIDEEVLNADIRAKRLSGNIDDHSSPWRTTKIHDKPAQLINYFDEQSNGRLFVPAGHFKRL